MKADNQTALQILYKMLKSRMFEQEINHLWEKGYVDGPVYLSIGQEATIAAVMALNADDIIFAAHRNLHILIGADVPVDALFGEFLGLAGGVCGGRAGCFSAADASVNLFGSSPLSAAQFGKAVGVALSQKLLGNTNATAVFAGDGAAADGAFTEAVNAACLYGLPVLFFIENNGFAGPLRTGAAHSLEDLRQIADAYKIPGIFLDGNNAIDVYEAMGQAAMYAKANASPVILESRTYRLTGYTAADGLDPADEDELRYWLGRDAIETLSAYMVENGFGHADDLRLMREKIESEMREEARKALAGLTAHRTGLYNDYAEGVRK